MPAVAGMGKRMGIDPGRTVIDKERFSVYSNAVVPRPDHHAQLVQQFCWPAFHPDNFMFV